MEHPSNPQIAELLEQMADHLDFEGSRYPARAYQAAAATICRLPTSIDALAMAGRAIEVRGIGTSIQSRVVELCETGEIAELERLRERTPTTLMVLTHLPGVSRRKAFAIWEALEPASLDDLMDAVDDGRLMTVRGVGPATADTVRAGLLTLDEEPEEAAVQLLRSHAARAAADVRVLLEHAVPGLRRIHVGGQFARGHELVDVLDLVVVADVARDATHAVRDQLDHRGWYTVSEEAMSGDDCTVFALQGSTGSGVRIHVADEANESEAVLFGIGPVEHARDVCRRASHIAPWTSMEVAGTEPPDAAMYRAAGIAYVPPELRDRPEILEQAAAAPLPRLVEVADLSGEMHCHSNWSDGRTPM